MRIKFSQELIIGLVTYLGTNMVEIAKDFPYSRPYLYKIADGSTAINEEVNQAFNKLWNDRGLTVEDLDNIYKLIDILKAGKQKETQYHNNIDKGDN